MKLTGETRQELQQELTQLFRDLRKQPAQSSRLELLCEDLWSTIRSMEEEVDVKKASAVTFDKYLTHLSELHSALYSVFEEGTNDAPDKIAQEIFYKSTYNSDILGLL